MIAHTGDGAQLINLWEHKNKVIIVDAAHGGGEPGTIYRLDMSKNEIAQELTGYSSHSFGVADAIALGREIRRLPKQLIVFAVEGIKFDHGTSLSPEVAKTVTILIEQIFAACKMFS
jgi:hydrogenase maturation protease